jgi:hypothetical protein
LALTLLLHPGDGNTFVVGIERRPSTKWTRCVHVSTAFLLCVACKRVTSDAGPPTADRLAKACIKLTTCDPFVGSISSCISDARYFEAAVSVYRPAQVRCLAEAAGGCDAVLACSGLSVAECTEPTFACDGDNLVQCSDGMQRTIDCSQAPASEGGTCIAGTCGIEACLDHNTSSCNGTELASCSGDGVLTRIDCRIFGETCNSTDGFPRCGTVGALFCQSPRCDGDVLVNCNFNEEHRVDCGALYAGGECSARAMRCGFDEQCSLDSSTFCVGEAVEVCVLGQVMVLDCVELGFVGCSNGACVR